MAQKKLFDDELHEAMQQLFDETIEAVQLAKVSPDIDDLAATFAVALLKLGELRFGGHQNCLRIG